MSAEDKVINAAVRRVLTGFWMDITLVNVSTFNGVVHLSGHLQRMTASHSNLDSGSLMELDRRVRTVPGVRGVRYGLANWQRTGQGQWLRLAVPAVAALPAPPPGEPGTVS